MRVLLIEDDARIARLIARAFTEAGHEVSTADNGTDGLARGATGAFDLIVLDILLPEMDGIEVCRRLRKERIRTPILMLTARDTVSDRVRGLDVGADDYLVKPFALEELLARVRALQRRDEQTADETLRVGDLTLDPARREAWRGERVIELTATEFQILAYLMRHPGRVLTKDQIMEQVWGWDTEVTSNVVEVYIHYLRGKVDQGFPRPLIRTVRGVGYTIKE